MLEVKWVDFVFLAECRCYGPHFSIETGPRVEVSPAAFASENFSGRCGRPTIAAGTRLPCACCGEHCVTPPLCSGATWDPLGKLRTLTPAPTASLLSGAGGSAHSCAKTVSASKHFHLKKLQRRGGWTGKIRSSSCCCRQVSQVKSTSGQGALVGFLLSSCPAAFVEGLYSRQI